MFTQSRAAGESVGIRIGIEKSTATKSTPQCKAWAPRREASVRADRSLAWALAPTMTHAAAPKSDDVREVHVVQSQPDAEPSQTDWASPSGA